MNITSEHSTESDEYKKCSKNIKYFINHYVYRNDYVSGKTLFDLYPHQENSINDYENNNNIIMNVERGVGQTEMMSAYLLHKLTFRTNYSIVVKSPNMYSTYDLIDKIRRRHNDLPEWMRFKLDRMTKGYLKLDNGNTIRTISSIDSMRGCYWPNLMVLPEFALNSRKTQYEFLKFHTNLAPPTSKMIIYSNDVGINDPFHDLYSESCQNSNTGFKPIKIVKKYINEKVYSFES